MITTQYMNIDLPTNSTETSYGTSGQDWASMINVGFTKVDQHTHALEFGNLIPSNVLSYDLLNLNNFSLLNVQYISFFNNSTASDPNLFFSSVPRTSLFVYEGELYYSSEDADTVVQITDSGSLVSTDIGGFQGDYTTDGSTVSFYGDDEYFVFYGASGASFADIQCGNVISNTTFQTNNFSGKFIVTEDIIFSDVTMKNRIPIANDGSFIGAYSDVSDTFNLVTDDIYAILRDANGGVSFPIATSDFPYTTVEFLVPDDPGLPPDVAASPQHFFGGMEKGFRRLGYYNSNNRKMQLICEFDATLGFISPNDGWVVTDRDSLGRAIYTKTVRINETTGDQDSEGSVVIFSRKIHMSFGSLFSRPSDFVKHQFPQISWTETNFGDYKEIEIQTTSYTYLNTAGQNVVHNIVLSIETVKGVFLNDS